MRHPIIAIFFCLPFLMKAQTPVQLKIGTRSGYEYNVFNANRNRILISEEGDTTSALQSGFFQHFNLEAGWKKKVKKSGFNLKAKSSFDYFPTLSPANVFRPEMNFGYTFKANKKSLLFFKSRYLVHNTNRIPDDTEVLPVPIGYQRLSADVGYKFKPAKYNKSQVQLFVLEKNYAEGAESALKYDAFGINFQTKQRFKRKRKPSNYLALEIDFQRRKYLKTYFGDVIEGGDEEEDFFEDETVTDRIWQYHTAQAEYTYGISKGLKIRSGLAFQQRLDILGSRFGYLQWQPFLKLEAEKGAFELNWKVDGILRSFSDLRAVKGSDELLVHRYLRSSLTVGYTVSDRLKVTLRGNFRRRWRNFSEQATSFLPYMNGMVSAGVKFQF